MSTPLFAAGDAGPLIIGVVLLIAGVAFLANLYALVKDPAGYNRIQAAKAQERAARSQRNNAILGTAARFILPRILR